MAVFGLLVLAPVVVVVAATIRLSSRGPVFFTQPRAGKGGVEFTIYKFRTMRPPREGEDPNLTDDARLTSVGRVLRKLSLDEIPQLLNVAKGDMSFVGPRPLHLSYVEKYSERQARRLEVNPGITGWAQVNGRNAVSWEERFELDVWYVQNRSFALDLRILARTFAALRGSGVSSQGTATMHLFEGSPPGEASQSSSA